MFNTLTVSHSTQVRARVRKCWDNSDRLAFHVGGYKYFHMYTKVHFCPERAGRLACKKMSGCPNIFGEGTVNVECLANKM